MPSHWQSLLGLAKAEVNCTLRSLPRALRERARQLPVTYEPYPNELLAAEDPAPEDLLGLLVGGDYAGSAFAELPSQIILFLENIWEMIADEGGGPHEFRQEVRTTLLHELGHYLGLDEAELDDRGLM